jgi:hypothetical protein
VVDTTCPWVSKVWNSVDKHQKAGMTSVIHGKYAHEETVATTSFCEDYICVKDMKEAEMLSNYILNGGDKEAFMKHFEKGVSKGFDPDVMLKKIGLANQTTMYKKETRAIGQLLQKTMMKKFGPAEIKNHYMEFDTICDATQVSDEVFFLYFDVNLTLTCLLRNDKTPWSSSLILPRLMVSTLFWLLEDGIHPTQLTFWRFRTTLVSDLSTSTARSALGLITPLRTARSQEKSSRRNLLKTLVRTLSWVLLRGHRPLTKQFRIR